MAFEPLQPTGLKEIRIQVVNPSDRRFASTRTMAANRPVGNLDLPGSVGRGQERCFEALGGFVSTAAKFNTRLRMLAARPKQDHRGDMQ
jgi:hypothetical protein